MIVQPANAKGIDSPSKHHSVLALTGLAYALFLASAIIFDSILCTNHLRGARSGFVHGIFCIVPWCLVVLPVSGLVHALCRRNGWWRARTIALLLPGMASVIFLSGSLILAPPTAANLFKKNTGQPLPPGCTEVRMFHEGSCLGFGMTSIFSFRCRPEDTDELIRILRILRMDPQSDQSQTQPLNIINRNVTASWPDPATWKGSNVYFVDDDDSITGLWQAWLIADSTRERVYVVVDQG